MDGFRHQQSPGEIRQGVLADVLLLYHESRGSVGSPRACLPRAPFHALAIRLLLALLAGVFTVEEKFNQGWRAERAINKVGVEGRGFSDINITKNSVLCNKESSLTGVYYKMFDVSQEHVKIKTQRSLHWMFILFTRLGCFISPPPISKQCKQVTHLKTSPLCTKDSVPLTLPGWRATAAGWLCPLLSLWS